MERRPDGRNPTYLILGLSVLIGLTAYINTVAPDTGIRIAVFYVLMTASVGLFGLYLLRNRRHVLIVTFGLGVYLLLRMYNLRSPLYAVLLLASMMAVEYLARERT